MSKYSTEITLILTLLEGWVEGCERDATECITEESSERYTLKAAAYQNVIDWIQSADMPFKQGESKFDLNTASIADLWALYNYSTLHADLFNDADWGTPKEAEQWRLLTAYHDFVAEEAKGEIDRRTGEYFEIIKRAKLQPCQKQKHSK